MWSGDGGEVDWFYGPEKPLLVQDADKNMGLENSNENLSYPIQYLEIRPPKL